MSALAHYIEDEGIPTTGVSLVREHSAGYRPPRFLWVPFPLGRPFGAPGAPGFQHRVLRAVLALLEREDGPVILEDFPHNAPAAADPGTAEEGWVCPVSFPPPPRDPQDIEAALVAEVEQLEPWYRISCSRRGRTTVGLGARDPVTLARFVAAHLDATPPALRPELGAGENLKLACEDLKAFYTEAATARPGPDDAHALAQWLWAETALARAFVLLEPRLLASGDASLRRVGSDYLIPRVQAHRRREPPSPA